MCLQPIKKQIRNSKYSPIYSIDIPCGKCLECLRDAQNEWVVRLYMESKYHSNILFFTLTYSPESVPQLVDPVTGAIYHTVFKKHVQDWFKRFRIRYQRATNKDNIKYFITSEYGPKTKRPHIHGLLFGISYSDFNRYGLSDWNSNFGFTDCKEIRLNVNQEDRDKSLGNVMRYLAKYCLKGEFENPYVEQKKVLPNFRLISKGIGKQFTLDIKDFVLYGSQSKKTIDYTSDGIESIIARSVVKIGKVEYSLPRYSKNIIYGQKTLLSFKIGQALLLRDDELYRKKFSLLQTQRNSSDIETFRNLVLRENDTIQIETSKRARSFETYYNKSKI